MPLTFRPIKYDPEAYTTFKYVGTSSIREGQLCYLSAADMNSASCTQFKGVAPATLPMSVTTGATVSLVDKGKYFPVFREDPDVESTVGTIAQNEYVTAFPLRVGVEFEVHKSVTESGSLVNWTSVGQNACMGSNGKWTPLGTTNYTRAVLAECIGTFNATWLRLRAK